MADSSNNRDSIISGKPYGDISSALRGVISNNSAAILKGVSWDKIGSILKGVIFSTRPAIIKGKPYSDMLAVLKGKPFNERKAGFSGHLYDKYLTLNYSLTNFTDLSIQPSDHPFIDRTEAYLEEYEEDLATIYMYFGKGREAYEYIPATKELTPITLDRPHYAAWNVEVYGENINARDFRKNIIDHLTKRNFDQELKQAINRNIDDKYFEFTISFGIKGTYSKIYCIMRVKATDERKAVTMGRPYPVYLLATDFGLYTLFTGSRWYHRSTARNALVVGRWITRFNISAITRGVLTDDIPGVIDGKPYSDRNAVTRAFIWNTRNAITLGVVFSIRNAVTSGKPYNSMNGLVLGKSFNDIRAILRAVILDIRNGVIPGKPYDEIRGIIKGLPRSDSLIYAITEGRDTYSIYHTHTPERGADLGGVLSEYNSIFEGRFAWSLGTSEGLGFFGSKESTNNFIRGVLNGTLNPVNNVRNAVIFARVFDDSRNAITEGRDDYNVSLVQNLSYGELDLINKEPNIYNPHWILGTTEGLWIFATTDIYSSNSIRRSIMNVVTFNYVYGALLGKNYSNIGGGVFASLQENRFGITNALFNSESSGIIEGS